MPGALRVEKPLVSYGIELDSLWSKWIDSTVETLKDGGDLCRHELSMIQCPTLVLHGPKDPIVPFYHPTYINEHITGSRLKSF